MFQYQPYTAILLMTMMMGCTPQIQLLVKQPATVNTNKIRRVAIGTFEIASVQEAYYSERKGVWEMHSVPLTSVEKQAIGRAVRDQVIHLLTTTPYFEVVYTEEFSKLENDQQLQKLISVQGYRRQEVDAIINGKIWLDLQRTDATELAKLSLVYVQGGEKGLDVEVERLAWWPYKQAQGTLAMEIKMTRIEPNEVVAVHFDQRTYRQQLGGAPLGLLERVNQTTEQVGDALSKEAPKSNMVSDDVLPSFEQLISDLSASIAASFVKSIAVTEKKVQYPVATGGNKEAQFLIEAGAYESAIQILEKITTSQKQPEDLYNLALAFEAKGDYGLAQNYYREAQQLDPSQLLYAQGLGRIERLQREFPQLKRQLTDKQ